MRQQRVDYEDTGLRRMLFGGQNDQELGTLDRAINSSGSVCAAQRNREAVARATGPTDEPRSGACDRPVQTLKNAAPTSESQRRASKVIKPSLPITTSLFRPGFT